MFSSVMNFSLSEWNSSPVVSTIDSYAVPLEEADFPSITLCPEPGSLIDPINYIEKVLNYIDVDKTPHDNTRTGKLAQIVQVSERRTFFRK